MDQGPRRDRPAVDRDQGPLLIRQRGGGDCGAAALATVAAWHGLDAGAARRAVGPARRGTDLGALARAAERLGLRARPRVVSYDALGVVPLPAIIHLRPRRPLRLGHYVVVWAWTPDGVRIADPARGVRMLTRRALCRRAGGHVLLVTRP